MVLATGQDVRHPPRAERRTLAFVLEMTVGAVVLGRTCGPRMNGWAGPSRMGGSLEFAMQLRDLRGAPIRAPVT